MLKIALLSAFIGSPGKTGLKITESCQRELENYGIDCFLFTDNHRESLEAVSQPSVQIEQKRRTVFEDTFHRFFFRQSFYPSKESTHNRLLAKLPKILFYKLIPQEYDFYIWVDSKFTLLDGWIKSVLDIIETCGVFDMAVCRHSERVSIWSEYKYMERHMREGSANLCSKYVLADLYRQVRNYLSDSSFIDDSLYECGCLFFSRAILNHKDFLEAWYAHNYYYSIQDQLSFPYLIKKYNINVFPLSYSVYHLPGTKYGYCD